MAFGINSWYYHSLQYRPIYSCGGSLWLQGYNYGDMLWNKNESPSTIVNFKLGTYSSVVTFEYIVATGSGASIGTIYNNVTTSQTPIVNTNGSFTYSYIWDGIHTTVGTTLLTRLSSSSTNWFLIKVSCPSTQSDPGTASLTFTRYQSGVFTFDLSSSIPSTGITISQADVSGRNSINCTGGINESDSLSGLELLITPGNITGSLTGSTPMTTTTKSYTKVNSIVVNGSTKTNNQTIQIGSTTVTVIINTTCQTYTA